MGEYYHNIIISENLEVPEMSADLEGLPAKALLNDLLGWGSFQFNQEGVGCQQLCFGVDFRTTHDTTPS